MPPGTRAAAWRGPAATVPAAGGPSWEAPWRCPPAYPLIPKCSCPGGAGPAPALGHLVAGDRAGTGTPPGPFPTHFLALAAAPRATIRCRPVCSLAEPCQQQAHRRDGQITSQVPGSGRLPASLPPAWTASFPCSGHAGLARGGHCPQLVSQRGGQQGQSTATTHTSGPCPQEGRSRRIGEETPFPWGETPRDASAFLGSDVPQ